MAEGGVGGLPIADRIERYAATCTGEWAREQLKRAECARKADRYLPLVKRTLAPILGPITDASVHADNHEATDLYAGVHGINLKISFSDKAFDKPWDILVRAYRDTGTVCDRAKIRDGWCKYYFIGHVDPRAYRFRHWVLADLDIYRDSWFSFWALERIIDNFDGTWMAAIDTRTFPGMMVVASGP